MAEECDGAEALLRVAKFVKFAKLVTSAAFAALARSAEAGQSTDGSNSRVVSASTSSVLGQPDLVESNARIKPGSLFVTALDTDSETSRLKFYFATAKCEYFDWLVATVNDSFDHYYAGYLTTTSLRNLASPIKKANDSCNASYSSS